MCDFGFVVSSSSSSSSDVFEQPSSTWANIVKKANLDNVTAVQTIITPVKTAPSKQDVKLILNLNKSQTRNGSLIQIGSLKYLVVGTTNDRNTDYYLVKCVVQYKGIYYFIPRSIDNWSSTGTHLCSNNFELLLEKIGYRIKDLSEKICRDENKKNDIKCNF